MDHISWETDLECEDTGVAEDSETESGKSCGNWPETTWLLG